MSTIEAPLRGRVFLLTRSAERCASLAAGLRALGARVDTRPTVSVEPPADPRPARNAVALLSSYDWVVFTSVNGVRFFRATCREVHGTARMPGPPSAAIGPATARELETGGDRPAVVAAESHSEGLARALAGRIRSGERALVVRPEVARPLLIQALRGMGVEAEPVAFYRNVPAPAVAAVAADVCRGRYDALVLTSPSSLERLLEAAPDGRAQLEAALGRARLIAIGPVTARAVERAGLAPAAVAAAPTSEALLESIRRLFA